MEWIKVCDRLPDKPGTYLVTAEHIVTHELVVSIEEYGNDLAPNAFINDETVFENGYAFGTRFFDGLDNLANVYAWMPAPAPFDPDEGK